MKKLNVKLTAFLSLVIVCCSTVAAQLASESPKGGLRPAEGFVPDASTAIRIAEAVLIPVYGEKTVTNERPYNAKLVDQEWVVKGSVPKALGAVIVVGGYSEVHINKKTGCIVLLMHTR